MGKPINLQDALLREMIKEKIPVTIFLTNGFETRIIDGQYPERKCATI